MLAVAAKPETPSMWAMDWVAVTAKPAVRRLNLRTIYKKEAKGAILEHHCSEGLICSSHWPMAWPGKGCLIPWSHAVPRATHHPPSWGQAGEKTSGPAQPGASRTNKQETLTGHMASFCWSSLQREDMARTIQLGPAPSPRESADGRALGLARCIPRTDAPPPIRSRVVARGCTWLRVVAQLSRMVFLWCSMSNTP